MKTSIDTSNQKTRSEEEQLYQHLLHVVQVESPHQVMIRFRALFVEGISYPESDIIHLLDRITSSKSTPEFKFFLNRCCHIMINRWHMQPQLRVHIPELIDLFAHPSTRIIVASPRHSRIRRLQELVQIFTQSEQYLTLRRLGQIMTQNHDGQPIGNKPLLTLIRRYPYLYDHCLMGDDCHHEHQRTVRQIQYQVQKKFEINLSQYVTNLVRSSSLGRQTSIPKVSNPTLLSDRELNSALKQFIGKVDGSYTYHDLAQNFLHQTRSCRSFKAFKSDLHEYLVSSLQTGASKQQFSEHLYKRLQDIYPNSENQKVDEFLLVRTCSQLLNFLVVDNSSPEHFTFVDLVSNQGTTITTALLLKVVLICRKVKPYLEKRLAILFNHYEHADTSCIQWLVRALEKLNIALSIYFGNIDLSYFNQIHIE